MIRFSCGDQSWAPVQHARAVELVTLLGFDTIDLVLGVNPRHLRAVDVASSPVERAAALAPLLEGLSLRVGDVFIGPLGDFETLAPNHPDEGRRSESRELFLSIVEFAETLGSPGITQVPGICWPGETAAESLRRAATELSARAEHAHARGLGYSVEAHLGSVVEELAQLRELLDTAPSLELTLDPSHLQAQDVHVREYGDLLSRTRHVHLRGARTGRPQVAMNENEIDLDAVASAMKAARYGGAVCLEYVCVDWRRCNECDVLTETLLLREAFAAALADAGESVESPTGKVET